MNTTIDEHYIWRILEGKGTAEEVEQLRLWAEASAEHGKMLHDVRQIWNTLSAAEPADPALQRQQRQLLQQRLHQMGCRRRSPSIGLSKIAAMLLVLCGIGGAVMLWNRHQQIRADYESRTWIDKAGQVSLTLSDGRCMLLNGNAPQHIDTDHEQGLLAEEGTLDYTHARVTEAQPEILYNKVETPAGGSYELILADGTHVWLNAQSQLRFPISFDEDERRVYLAGEAYFEVTTDAARPFIVSTQTGSLDIRVFGTHFDVEAYSPEQVRTTLMHGSVGIHDVARNEMYMLTPSSTALFNALNGQISIEPCDANEYLLWREGILSFEEMTVEQLMTRIARYYDIEASYTDDSVRQVTLTGMLRNTDHLGDLLRMLESASSLRFQQSGRQIIISSRAQ